MFTSGHCYVINALEENEIRVFLASGPDWSVTQVNIFKPFFCKGTDSRDNMITFYGVAL
jgi:hypothetical protein